ncbi:MULTISPECIES: tetratricopeptide repeat protein [Aestuariibaculum]|uniref:Tetratricopeptide repeat protein n=1 Tax=Aestuariibaculum lutulentum TaxID=2920935 RepID=A0ABS9RDZ1_9FLAO|nr:MULTISPECIES: tetratricopeptide repeat protein [Aestuariibaculum]MCH4551161.1 tetratricopeptide repeat protein [Aestuariibaculum lutulentum]MCR8666285.1 tetratricopeptide repeat protein [Aestuariibaculum sp. M13]
MEFSQDENNNLPLTKFESMLKTNHVLFFDSEEFENIIHHYLNQGKIALAKKAIKLGLDQHPTSVNLRLFKVEVYVFENKLVEADTLLNELYNLDPMNEEIYIQKANIFSKKDDHQQAIDVLKRALELTDDVVDLYSLIGMEYLFLDEFEKAKECFMKCLEEDLEDYSALYNVIYCFEFLNQSEEAIEYLNIFLDKNPYCEVAWHQLGKQYYNLKNYKKALAAYDFAIISDDTFVGAYLERGKVLEKLKRFNEAIENYTITLELDDPTSFALLRIGSCHEKLKNDELAVQYYYKTVHEDPLLDKGWIAITRFYNKKRNYDKALYYINKAINIDSENVVYWKLYAQINHRLNHLEEAERGFKKALELGNYELNTWLSRGDILIKLGEPEAAIYNFEQAIEFYPENSEIEYRLAGLYFSLNENDKGIFYLKNGIDHNEDYAFIIEELFPEVANKILVKNILKTNQ